MNKSKSIAIVVIGYGYWSPKLIRNVSAISDLHLVGVCEKDTTRHELIRREHPGTKVFQHYADVFSDPEVDAVIIATIPSSHYRIARAALEAGKHVLVEKPLTLTVEEGSLLCSLAAGRGRILMVDHTYLYAPAIQKLRTLVQSGALGEIYAIESTRTNLGLFQRDTNVIWDLAPHDFSILVSLIDERPEYVSAFGKKTVVHPRQRNGGQESDAHIILHYASGIEAHIHVSWISPVKVRQVTIVGSEQMVRYDQLAEQQIALYDQGVYPIENAGDSGSLFEYKTGQTTYPVFENSGEDLKRMLEDFSRAITAGTTPVSSAALSLDVVRLLAAANRSLSRGGKRVRVESGSGNLLHRLYAHYRPK